MKEYLRPEFEEVKYNVEDCLLASGDDPAQGENGGQGYNGLTEWP